MTTPEPQLAVTNRTPSRARTTDMKALHQIDGLESDVAIDAGQLGRERDAWRDYAIALVSLANLSESAASPARHRLAHDRAQTARRVLATIGAWPGGPTLAPQPAPPHLALAPEPAPTPQPPAYGSPEARRHAAGRPMPDHARDGRGDPW